MGTPDQSRPSTWRSVTAQYQRSDLRRSIWQAVTSIGAYVVLWYLMLLSLAYSYWLTLALAVVAAGFLIRIFIIFHDCGHGSFFASRRANSILGSICGVLTFTPYFQWRHEHALHHASSSDLDRRGHGDITMLTVNEYLSMTPWQQIKYRVFRQPLVMLLIGPAYTFVVRHRFVMPEDGPRERFSVYFTNIALLALMGLAALTIGFDTYLLIQVPVLLVAGGAAIWLFYCQHQFEGSYWTHHEEWDYEEAAIKGSSYLKLPRVLQWFTGNIGFHHVHHLCPRIPNYYLEQVHESHPRFQEVTTITLRSSLETFTLKLWDEDRQALVAFRELPAQVRSGARS